MALKKSFTKDKTICKVTFTVTPEAAHGAEEITIAGDWNNWSSTETKLSKKKDGTGKVFDTAGTY